MNVSRTALLSTAAYTAVALLGAGIFLALTLTTGDYTWVARLGGAGWVFLLSMIILMPTMAPWLRRRLEPALSAEASLDARHHRLAAASAGEITRKDPVCGMTVDPESTKWHSEFQGRRFAFCSKGCKEAFDREPTAYLAAS